MVFNDSTHSILNKFSNEYNNSCILRWSKFIKSKDLGIICIDLLNDEYRIVDEQKWLYSRLKYDLF